MKKINKKSFILKMHNLYLVRKIKFFKSEVQFFQFTAAKLLNVTQLQLNLVGNSVKCYVMAGSLCVHIGGLSFKISLTSFNNEIFLRL